MAPLLPILVAFGTQVFKIASKKLADDAVKLGGKIIRATDRRTKTVSNLKQLKNERTKFTEKQKVETEKLKKELAEKRKYASSKKFKDSQKRRLEKIKKLKKEGVPLTSSGRPDGRFKKNKSKSSATAYRFVVP